MPKQGPLKWSLPDVVDPPDTICFQINVPNDRKHLGAFYGAIFLLSKPYAWGDDTDHTAIAVGAVWRRIFDRLIAGNCTIPAVPGSAGADSEDIMIRQSPDNPCLLQTSIDGVNWCTFADLSKCSNFGNQPGSGGTPPPPGGGTQQTCAQLSANQTLLIPTLVNTGDTVLLNSANGAGWDGGEFIAGPVWRVPNGDVFAGGLDVGFPVTDGGDPVPSANHMSLIIGFGGGPTYLALPEGVPVTIPGGVSNAQLWVQVNDSAIGNNQGSYDVCVTVTNNQAAAWSHVLDFRSGSFGFGLLSDSVFTNLGDWEVGSGFVGQQQIGSNGTYYVAAGASYTPSSALHLTHLDMLYDLTIGTIAAGGDGTYIQTNFGLPAAVPWASEVTADDQHLVWDGDTSGITLLNFFVGASNVAGGPFGGGACAIKQLTISGIGFDPFA